VLAFLFHSAPSPLSVGVPARFFTYFGLRLRIKCTRYQASAGLTELGNEGIGGARMPGDKSAEDIRAAVAAFHVTLGEVIRHSLVAPRATTRDNWCNAGRTCVQRPISSTLAPTAPQPGRCRAQYSMPHLAVVLTSFAH
jgi:hypothetical protein